MPIPELNRRQDSVSPNTSKISLPYPTFSKAHSREAISSTENIATPKQHIFTPDPTDLQQRDDGSDGKVTQSNRTSAVMNAPPSPPLTALDPAAAPAETRRPYDSKGEEMRRKLSEVRRNGGSHLSGKSRNGGSHLSGKSRSISDISALHRSKPGTPTKMKPMPVTVDDESSIGGRTISRTASPTSSKVRPVKTAESITQSVIESDTTSIAPEQHRLQVPFSPEVVNVGNGSSPATEPDSSPRTPTLRGTTPFLPPSRKETPAYEVPYVMGYNSANEDSPMPPPPPPPPPMMSFQQVRVDYLLQNGGLNRTVPKIFVAAPEPNKVPFSVNPELSNPTVRATYVQKFFEPFNTLLEDYMKVMSKNGSVAVATGYRSVARRLLDRLESVFARDISSERCACTLCLSGPLVDENLEDERGISWGEVLEYVCGRRELPPWPPFQLETKSVGLGILAGEQRVPMQKLDIDVPDEYRDHYIAQSKKTKLSVDRWLASQVESPTSPPEDADDDTLTFAMLTYLEPEQRPVFKELLGIAPTRPASVRPGAQTPGPISGPTNPILGTASLAIQRLYRLSSLPRAPEAAIYMLNNPHLHNALATLAAVSDGEWEILTSGRFDGFLRSGAEDLPPDTFSFPSRGPTPANIRNGMASRGPTPAPTSSTPAPASAGAPVAMDEETEISILAEVEREIFLGMEALEDAFEALHVKAETVRHTLRERGAGLAMASQQRRGGALLEARMGTPFSAYGGVRGWDSETDDGNDDCGSELAPDDSASNVSRSRVRRPKRRSERRTPAPVEEEDEEEEEDVRQWDKRGRR
jgi:hypothetical protein